MDKIIGTHLAVSWDCCKPFMYGLYEGKLLDGTECNIDVDYYTRVYKPNGEQVGTDQIRYWYCDVIDLKSILDNMGESI